MTEDDDRPLLFLDVDGTVIPFGRHNSNKAATAAAEPYLAGIDPTLGDRLTGFPCALVWATTWEDHANTVLAPLLGLPRLPVVRWPAPSSADEREDRWWNLHWKTRALTTWAGGRPFVWVDDEITGADIDWVAARHPGRALLHPVDAAKGLTHRDLATLDVWFRQA
ncbi:hypothetical protein LO763_19555 [Glycomyces sp. A-F 0318]|uniref:HAD domain-containing protein n=1 Tax=Glycomyces amatae TaxID=2881355 RepID=UPI001E64B1CC|nr:HAD domain-containing protein [Glycomyces amatae]MCD0445808.1 hypothetical protein [Glycomyces amatae]